MEFIEVSAKTVDEALTEASISLGIPSSEIEYEVVEKGSTGFLGIGSKNAVIKARKKFSVEESVKEFLKSVSVISSIIVIIIIHSILKSISDGLENKSISYININYLDAKRY